MKKKGLNGLFLNKKIVSNLQVEKLKGGKNYSYLAYQCSVGISKDCGGSAKCGELPTKGSVCCKK